MKTEGSRVCVRCKEDRGFFPFPCTSAILAREIPTSLTKENCHARTHCLGRVAGFHPQRPVLGGRREASYARSASIIARATRPGQEEESRNSPGRGEGKRSGDSSDQDSVVSAKQGGSRACRDASRTGGTSRGRS